MNAFKRITVKRKNYLTLEILGKKKEELPEEKKEGLFTHGVSSYERITDG